MVLVLLLATTFPFLNTCSLILFLSFEIILCLKENSTSFLYNEDFLQHIKTPDHISGVMSTYGKYRVFFSHPDYTVGPGIPPDQPPKRVADYNRR